MPDVQHTMYGLTLTRLDDYTRDLHEPGFTGVTVPDLTLDWTTFCTARVATWQAQHTRHVRGHGEATYARLAAFYTVVPRLLTSGSLGAVHIVTRLA